MVKDLDTPGWTLKFCKKQTPFYCLMSAPVGKENNPESMNKALSLMLEQASKWLTDTLVEGGLGRAVEN